MIHFIKYLSIIISTIYSYNKILNYCSTNKTRICSSLFCITSPALCVLIKTYTPYPSSLFVLLISFIFFGAIYKSSLETTITATIISYGISYITFNTSALLITIFIVLCIPQPNFYHNNPYYYIFILILQSLTNILLFLPKRLKKGIPFLLNKLNNTSIMFLSIILLFFVIILSNNTGYSSLFVYLYFVTTISTLFFFISWRNGITRTYRDKLRDRDIDILTEHIEELEAEYKKLAEDKDELAKIVHRDNKLVPAMLLSVESFLTEFSDATPEMKSRGQELMAELNKEAESRKGILKQQNQKCTAKLISTGIPYLDSVLTYMQEKAMSKDIVLSASGDPGIANLVARTIEEEDLKTLAADMLENAIIANTYNHGSNVYFVIGYFGKHLAIYVYDSGIPFTKEVLLDLGIQKHTTHEADGGSGIGLMTIFELVRKYRATYIIDEYSTPTGPYTKRITIVFDKRRKYILNTSRPKEEIDFLRQRADLIIESRKEPHIK